MGASLRQSLEALLRPPSGAPTCGASVGAEVPRTNRLWPRPSDFCAYFDLLGQQRGPAERAEHDARSPVAWRAAEVLAAAPPFDGCGGGTLGAAWPRIATLASDHYEPWARDALARWWDTDPDNALSLVPVGAEEFADGERQATCALRAVEASAGNLFVELTTVTCEIVLAKPGVGHRMSFGGVSSFAAWGAICINQQAHHHWVDYLRTIVHESAHLLLFGMTRETPLVLNELAERRRSPLRGDGPRPVDGIFHAAFVSAREAYALDACLAWLEASNPADYKAQDQLERALADSVCAFWDCCGQLDQFARLSKTGHDILEDTRAYMARSFEVEAPDP